jgi:hypothetical protein
MWYSFNWTTKVITLTPGTISVSIRDIWSRWVDRHKLSDNSKYLPAFSQVWWNDIDAIAWTSIPIYCFLQNGRRIKPQESNHNLSVYDWVLLVLWGGDPFIDTTWSYNVRVNYSQPVQAITVTSTNQQWTSITPADVWSHPDRYLDNVENITTPIILSIDNSHSSAHSDMVTINEWVKKASKLIPHNTNI